MAENVNPLILPIGADPSQFEKSISEVKAAYRQLAEDIQNKPFNLVSAKDKQNLADFGRTIQSLEGNLAGATEGTKKARTALTSLSLVAQDAPFGFIAIQNNLPAVIQSFSELSKGSKGLTGAFKEIGSQLIGPAGAFLAFSAVTAAVTYLIKEYGSLNGAIKAFVTGNQAAVKSQNEFNKAYQDSAKSIGGEEAQIKVLTQTLLSENSTQKQRLEAYRLLKQINPDVVAGINEQNLATDKSRQLIEAAAKVQIEYIKLRAQEGSILKVLDGLKEQEFAANGKLNKVKEDEIKLKEKLANIDKKIASGIPLTAQERTTDKQRNLLLKEYADDISNARKPLLDIIAEQDKWTNSLGKSYNRIGEISSGVKNLNDDLKNYENGLKELSKFQLQIEPQDLDSAFNIDKIISDLTKYGNILLDTSKNELERKDALQKIIEINPKYFQGLTTEKSGLSNVKNSIEDLIRQYQVLRKQKEDDARISELNSKFNESYLNKQDQIAKAEEKRFETISELTYAQDRFGNSTDKLVEKINATGFLSFFDNEQVAKQLEIFNKQITKATVDLEKQFRFLQEPLEGLFTTLLDSGESSWREFADNTIKQIKRITAALLAKALIKGLANLISLGTSSVVTGALKGISTEALGDFLDNSSKVDFGGLQGGMQMNGQVVFVQRGSDLVGVLNRTNSTIGRIG